MSTIYATLGELQARLDEDGLASTSARDANLERALESASRQIDGMTGDFFYPLAAATYTLSTDDTGFLSVPSLRTITSLATDDNGNRTYTTTWAATDYDLEPENATIYGRPYTGIRLAPNGRYTFPRLARSVRIVGDWGWATVPGAIKEACLILASRLYTRKDAPFGIAGAQGVGELTLISKQDPDVVNLIQPFRRFRVGVV